MLRMEIAFILACHSQLMLHGRGQRAHCYISLSWKEVRGCMGMDMALYYPSFALWQVLQPLLLVWRQEMSGLPWKTWRSALTFKWSFEAGLPSFHFNRLQKYIFFLLGRTGIEEEETESRVGNLTQVTRTQVLKMCIFMTRTRVVKICLFLWLRDLWVTQVEESIPLESGTSSQNIINQGSPASALILTPADTSFPVPGCACWLFLCLEKSYEVVIQTRWTTRNFNLKAGKN